MNNSEEKLSPETAYEWGITDASVENPPALISNIDVENLPLRLNYMVGFEFGRIETSEKWKGILEESD